MHLRPLYVLVAVLLYLPAPGMAQRSAPRFVTYSPMPALDPRHSAPAFRDGPRYSPTHWKEGLAAGALIGGLFGAYLSHGLCRDFEGRYADCFAAALGGAVVLAVPTGLIGALIGGAFPKRPPQSAAAGSGPSEQPSGALRSP